MLVSTLQLSRHDYLFISQQTREPLRMTRVTRIIHTNRIHAGNRMYMPRTFALMHTEHHAGVAAIKAKYGDAHDPTRTVSIISEHKPRE